MVRSVKPNPLLSKVEKLLVQRFPAPATVRLEDHNGIYGVITSREFAGMDTVDRQNLICDLLAKTLKPNERWRILAIVAVTPDEGTGYLAGPD